MKKRPTSEQYGSIFANHLSAQEISLLSLIKIQEHVGHPLHKGIPREMFIKEFLLKHIGESHSVGTGEIIDLMSKPKESRNQIDIILYDNKFPKLDVGGGCSSFFVESVEATIEVKSTLTSSALKAAMKAAGNIRELCSLPNNGRLNVTPRRFLVAYSYPGASMESIFNQIEKMYLDIAKQAKDGFVRFETCDNSTGFCDPALMLDGVFVLGRGFVVLENTSSPDSVKPKKFNRLKWTIGELS